MSKILGFIHRLPRTIANIFLRIFNPELSNPVELLSYQEVLSENQKFKDRYKGERCFILGSGPSIKKQDLLPIKDEHLFVANSFPYSDLYDKLSPQFYVTWDDIQFAWDDPEIGEYRLSLFKKIHKLNPKTTWVLPVKEKEKIENRNVLNNENVLYTYLGAKWEKYLKRKQDFNCESQMPECNNVINIAIMSAIYMGFTEIYLMGVDMTSFMSLYEYSSDQAVNKDYTHFYEHSEKEEAVVRRVLYENSKNEARLKLAAKKLRYFRYIDEIAQKKGVKIVNMSAGGGLDVFPRTKYEEWLEKNHK